MPRLVRFGGTAKGPDGTALTGVVGITFSLYAAQTGGTPLWQETQNLTADSNGHYSALLGSTKNEGLPAELFTGEAYALKAVDAETIGGLPPPPFPWRRSGSMAALRLAAA